MREFERADALERALRELRAGIGQDAAARGLDPADRALLATADGLGAVGPADGPSASFVLGLEEQLRTDLRLNPSLAEAGRTFGWLPAALALAVIGAAVVIGSEPGDLAYALRSRLEGLAVAVSPTESSDSVAFADGRKRLEEVARAVHDDAESTTELEALLAEVLRLYAAGTVAAVTSEDDGAIDRARLEVRAAETELLRLGEEAQPGERAAINETRAALERLRVPVVASAAVGASTPAAPAPTHDSEPSPTAGEIEPRPSATLTAPPPEASATAVATLTATSSVTPSPLPTATPETPATKPTRERPAPSSTPVPRPDPSGTPGIVAPTPTRDRWPTETADPRDPGATETPPGPPSQTPPAERDPGATP